MDDENEITHRFRQIAVSSVDNMRLGLEELTALTTWGRGDYRDRGKRTVYIDQSTGQVTQSVTWPVFFCVSNCHHYASAAVEKPPRW